jgi:ABC-2 type transport system ATP-binding protein
VRNDLNTEIHLRIIDLSHEYVSKKSRSKTNSEDDQFKLRGIDTVNLDVKFGEFIGVLGPNGCGKSTLLKILNSSLSPDNGKILIADKELSPLNNRLKRQIGVVFQDVALDPKLTISQNLLFSGRLYGIKGLELEERMNILLKQLDLFSRKDDLVEILSGGMARKVELAKALVSNPKILLMDEPSVGLDPSSRQEFWGIIENVRKTGTTILFTTHLLDEAEKCDRVAIMFEGKLLTCAPPSELKRNVGKQVVNVTSKEDLNIFLRDIEQHLNAKGRIVGQSIHIALNDSISFDLFSEKFAGRILSLSTAEPSLDDVFFEHTGRRLNLDAVGVL